MSDPTFIAWLDPGEVTGLAWADLVADRFGSGQYGEDELVHLVDSLVATHHGRIAIGWELYLQTPRSKGIATYSLRAIARVRALCRDKGVPILKGQPSSARAFRSTVAFLRRLGWYRPGMPHANDAAAHLFRYLLKQRPIPENIRKRLPAGY